MPSADAKSQIAVRFNSPEEKAEYKHLVKERYDATFAQWAAQLVRDHFRGVTEDSPIVIELRERLDTSHQEVQRLEAENLYLRRLNESNSREIREIRGRMYGEPKTYSTDLFSMMYSWFLEHPATTRKELIDHLVDYISIPNLVEEMKSIEMLLIGQGIISIDDGVIQSLVVKNA